MLSNSMILQYVLENSHHDFYLLEVRSPLDPEGIKEQGGDHLSGMLSLT